MTGFWTGVAVGAVLMPMVVMVALGFWACCWGPWRSR